jgi:molybdopterin molybdotransferase
VKSVDEHLKEALDAVEPLAAFDMLLLEAHNTLLAQDVVATRDLPRFDNSAMDGYAVRAADLAGASEERPITLPVVGDIAAGSYLTMSIRPGTTARIMTGAPLPAGSDAVVPQEWTDHGIASVQIRQTPTVGQHVRCRGEDVEAGTTVLKAGNRLTARQIGLLAALGHDRVLARPRPRVVVLSTGSELVEPGAAVGPAQITDSNSFLLTSAAREAGAVAYRVGLVPDDPRVLMDAIEDQFIRADLIVTSGGVSVGTYDVVKEVLGKLGTVRFMKVAMQPGMPQGFGVIGPDETPIFTLPGNPVSCYVSFEVFVRPVLRKLAGQDPVGLPIVKATCTSKFSSPEGKRQYARARLTQRDNGTYAAEPLGGGVGSHRMGDLSDANALIVVPEPTTTVLAGARVDVMVLERRGT